jgi:hypothetical protein
MAKIRYKYNPSTCRYEPFYIKGKVLRYKIFIFLFLSFVLASIGYYSSIQFFQSIDEMALFQQNQKIKIEWNILHKRIQKNQHHLKEIIKKDDHTYRVILDSNPLEASIREAGTGGSEKLSLKTIDQFPIIVSDYVSLHKIKHQIDIEVQSYQEIEKILNDKIIAWAARPAIQPISNETLDRLHLTYGLRKHPIFHVLMEHKGLDFAAAHGTPVYATGDGKIIMAYFSGSYGNVIYLEHGHDYETRYAHLSKFAVAPGDYVKRGQIIGYVGNTGNSVASHLHYEVLYKGGHVNPINFFQRDLNNTEYQKLIEAGSKNNISLD